MFRMYPRSEAYTLSRKYERRYVVEGYHNIRQNFYLFSRNMCSFNRPFPKLPDRRHALPVLHKMFQQ